MIIVSQDGMLFVNLDRISCVKILHRGPGLVDILAIDTGESNRLGTYRSEDDARKVLSAIYTNYCAGRDVMHMPDKLVPCFADMTSRQSSGSKDKLDQNGHSCITCKYGATPHLGCQYCSSGNMWEAKE